jgi:hypothetical protein
VLPNRRIAAAALALLLVGGLTTPPNPSLAVNDRLPNLRMMPLRDWTIQWSGSHRLLRFTAIMTNVGPGPFEIRGSRTSTSTPTMSVRQAIGNDAGGERTIATSAVLQWAGDGHNHWHAIDTMIYQIWPANGGAVRRDSKVGFCFLDSMAVDLSLPRAPQAPYYRGSFCGGAASLRNRMGISVGWGDHYPAHFAFQWIDITGLPAGSYIVKAKVDPFNHFLEQSDGNNCFWAKINIPSSGSTVRVLTAGYACKQPPVRTFPGATEFNPPRTLSMNASTHTGYRFSATGVPQEQKILTFSQATTAVTPRVSPVPGRDGEWFYVDSGPFNDFWLKKSSRVKLVP